jgi:hypothetical protein
MIVTLYSIKRAELTTDPRHAGTGDTDHTDGKIAPSILPVLAVIAESPTLTRYPAITRINIDQNGSRVKFRTCYEAAI